ncbi:MAG TPA: metal-sensitive transcriptional regulator [Verrucomicrobiae bacterium]|jgi:DNA-binding FrmR family transcriptional regulator
MKHMHPKSDKDALILRLRKIRGQVQGIEKLVLQDADCTEVLNQVISARNALKSFGENVIHSHARDCIENVKDAAQGRRNLRSLITVLHRYVS